MPGSELVQLEPFWRRPSRREILSVAEGLTNTDPETVHFSLGSVGSSRLCLDQKACVAQPPPAVLHASRKTI